MNETDLMKCVNAIKELEHGEPHEEEVRNTLHYTLWLTMFPSILSSSSED
jgi:hypothetical protein